jgi:hypothetical protein
MPLDQDTLARLADDALTFIEQREAEQIAYGVYDVSMTGAEVIGAFQPLSAAIPADLARDEAVTAALEALAARHDILRLDEGGPAVEGWVLRSRLAEIVRLLSLLRQRIVWGAGGRDSHRLSSSKRLTSDVNLSVVSRRVPRRDLPARQIIEGALGGSAEHRQAAALLLQVIEASLPKLRSMSGFQSRAFEAILRAVELDGQRAQERGVVVTASTGAGKTYAFFLPVLAKALVERCLRGRVAVKAICVYPRVALSENQLGDFIEVLFHLNRALERAGLPALTIGIESGATLYDLDDFGNRNTEGLRRRGWLLSEGDVYLSPFAYCTGVEGKSCEDGEQRLGVTPASPRTLFCPSCGTRYPFIMFARHGVMERQPPDILVATTESLNRRLTASRYQYLFGDERFAPPSVIMLDEIHLQTSTAGTQVALLLRRLITRLRASRADRRERDNLAFVGLSATIAQPVQFVAELTGIRPERITEVRPQDDELEIIGAERFIFVRATEAEDVEPISTLIQTAMCVLHTMPQPAPESGLSRYRSFGFVQSLDVVGRWRYQMEDAERAKPAQRRTIKAHQTAGTPPERWPILDVPLYMYRQPPQNRALFPRLLGAGSVPSCGCEGRHGPDRTCPLFQAGECWWVLGQPGAARQEPLAIKRKSGADRATLIEAGDDLIITTSALEVGYDDDALMCVIQYGAPANIASFVQRKGRGGRKVGTRPIVVTVLSPYSPAEIFLYRNQHLLTDPTFRKLPLNTQNSFLQRIHGFYAILDWMARVARREGVELDLDGVQEQALALLQRRGEDQDTLLALRDYMARAFSLSPADAGALLGDPAPDGVLLGPYLELIRRVAGRLAAGPQRYGVKGRYELRDRLPQNLFSDINLPEVRVSYDGEGRGGRDSASVESISLALFSTMPGNVTFRATAGSAWVPPLIGDADDLPRMVVSDHYRGSTLKDEAKVVRLPARALRQAQIDPGQIRDLRIYRPEEIAPRPFSRDNNTAFWYGDPTTGELSYHEDQRQKGANEHQLAHSSSGYPILAVDIQFEDGEPSPASLLTPASPALRADPLGVRLARQVVLYSDEPDVKNMIDVRLLALGSQYAVNFHWNRAEPIEGVVGFTDDPDHHTPCALGYQMRTEGLAIDLSLAGLERLRLPPQVVGQIRYAAARHAFITELTVERSQNIFAAANLADALLTVADLRCTSEGVAPAALGVWLSSGDGDARSRIERTLQETYRRSPKKVTAAMRLADEPAHLAAFARIYADVAAGGKIYRDHLHDTFKYGVAQALKQTVQELAGVEALRYIGAWARLRADYGTKAGDRVWLYEIGMGGVGVMRAAHRELRDAPERFWSILSQKMTRCQTAKEEALLRHMLDQPEEWLEHCDVLARRVRDARAAGERQRAIEGLLAEVRLRLGVVIRQEDAKALLRLFVAEYIGPSGAVTLANWRLYREVNAVFLADCAMLLGREPTFSEAKGMLYQRVSAGEDAYRELRLLLEIHRAEHGAGAEREIRQAFESAVERRLLLNCQCSCPSCLNDRGGQESPTTAWMLLSRPLLTAWLADARSSQTLTLAAGVGAATLSDDMRRLFEAGARCIYLKAPGGNLDELCRAISYLTDAGVDTSLGLFYPAITDIQGVIAGVAGAGTWVELTIRPIY